MLKFFRWHKMGWFFLLCLCLCLGAAVFSDCREARASGQSPAASDLIRVGLLEKVDQVDFSVTKDCQLIDSMDKKVLSLLKAGELWRARSVDGGLELIGGGQLIRSSNPVRVQTGSEVVAILNGRGDLVNKNAAGDGLAIMGAGGRISVVKGSLSGQHLLSARGKSPLVAQEGLNLITVRNGNSSHRYRGVLEFRPAQQGLTIVNELPVEEYLYGVTPSEMPSSWPKEALKAQAVVSRSYALARLRAPAGDCFDVFATQSSQVYHGYDWENKATNNAVDETGGIIMTCGGLPVDAVFHSSSGGFTENAEDVWKYPLNCIQARDDPYDINEKFYNWKVIYSDEQLIKLLNDAGYHFKDIADLRELERTSTGARVKRLEITGTDKDGMSVREEIYNADKVRTVLGLKSSIFTMQKEFDEQEKNLVKVTITGNGFGHGLGMSQYGARGLAEKGYSYQEILKYYYKGVNISKNYGSNE
jgi:stage II sporulation protein D